MPDLPVSADAPHALNTAPAAPEPPPADPSLTNRIFFGSDGLRAGWSLLLYAMLLAVLLTLAQSATDGLYAHRPTRPAPAHSALTVRSAVLHEYPDAVAVLLATLAMALLERQRFSRFGLNTRAWFARFAAGVFWGAAFLSALVFLLRANGLLVFDGRLLSGSAALRFGALWMIAFLGVGFFEETLFRGYLLLTLARGLTAIYRITGARSADTLGFWTSAIILSFGFGMVHTTNAGESPVGLVAAGLAGIVCCFSLWRSGSLWWAIGFHTTWDWAESYVYGVADSGNMVEGHLYDTHPHGNPLLSGGFTGPEGSVWVFPILFAVSAVIVVTLRREPPSTLESSHNPAHVD